MRRPLAVLAATTLLAATAGCGQDPAPAVSATTPAPLTSTTSSATAPAAPTTPPATGSTGPTPGDPPPSSRTPTSAPPSTEPVPKRTTRVSVSPKHRERTLTGSGARLIKVDLSGDFGLGLDLDCSRCRGRVVLTQPERLTPWVDQLAPVSGQFIVSILKRDHHPAVIVRAQGRWKLRLYDWNRTAVRTGTVRGQGSTFFFLNSRAPALTYSYRPADAQDSFSVRAPGTKEGQMRVFGTDERTRATRITLDLPALIIVHTRGTWTIRPSK